MSLPQFPTTSPPITREDAINQIISSIAMEELGLSHIINAEGEKLQYVLGTIPGITGPAATIEDVLKVNDSIRAVLQSAAETQSILRNKLQNALSSAVLTGPTGPKGATGPAGAACVGANFRFESGGEAMTLPAGTDGKPTIPVLLGVGTFSTEAVFDGEDIGLTGAPDTAANFAFIVPRGGTISDITSYFYATEQPGLLGATGTATAQLYKAESATSYLFKQIAGVTLEPELSSGTVDGTILIGSASGDELNIPVKSGDRLLLAYKAHTTGTLQEVTLTGFASTGLAITC